MSRDHGSVGLAIEWSPRGVAAYDHATRQTRVAADLASLGLSGRSAVLALSRRGVFVRTARVPNASPDEVRTILTMRVGELFPLPVVDLAWDFSLTDDVNDEGRLAIVAAVPCADLRRAQDAASSAGISIKAAVPLALGSAMIAQDMGLHEAAVVERADDGPAVDVVHQGSLRASRATPPTVPLETEVARALSVAGMEGVPMVAAGGADVPSAERHTDRTALSALAEATLDRLKLRLELPEAVAAQAAIESKRRLRLSLLVLMLSVAFFATATAQYSDAKGEADRLTSSENNRLQKIKNEAKKATAAGTTQTEFQTQLKTAFEPAQRISDILAVTTRAVPNGVWLNNLSIERGKAMSLRGTATATDAGHSSAERASTLLRNLDQQPERRFRNVTMSNANSTELEKKPVTVFVIQAFPVGNLPLLEKPGTKTTSRTTTTTKRTTTP